MPAQRCLRAIFHGKLNRVQFKIKSEEKRKKKERKEEKRIEKRDQENQLFYTWFDQIRTISHTSRVLRKGNFKIHFLVT